MRAAASGSPVFVALGCVCDKEKDFEYMEYTTHFVTRHGHSVLYDSLDPADVWNTETGLVKDDWKSFDAPLLEAVQFLRATNLDDWMDARPSPPPPSQAPAAPRPRRCPRSPGRPPPAVGP